MTTNNESNTIILSLIMVELTLVCIFETGMYRSKEEGRKHETVFLV